MFNPPSELTSFNSFLIYSALDLLSNYICISTIVLKFNHYSGSPHNKTPAILLFEYINYLSNIFTGYLMIEQCL